MNISKSYYQIIIKIILNLLAFILILVGFFAFGFVRSQFMFHLQKWVVLPGLLKILSVWFSYLFSLLIAGSVGYIFIYLAIRIYRFSKQFKTIRKNDLPITKPTLADFDLNEDDYHSYNRRADINFLGTLLAYAAFLTILILSTLCNIQAEAIFLLFLAPALGIAVKAAMNKVDNYLAKKWPQYERVKKYEIALNNFNKLKLQSSHEIE